MSKIDSITTEDLLMLDMVMVANATKKSYNIVFSDGEVLMRPKEIILNRIIWEFFKETKITRFSKQHNIMNYYVEGFFNSSSTKRMLENMFAEVVDRYIVKSKDRSILNEYVYSLFPKVFANINELIVLSNIEYASSISILDFLEIQFNPKIIKTMEDLKKKPEPALIKQAYDVIDDVMRHDEAITYNPVRLGYITKNFRIPQLQQMLGPIGFGSEIDNKIFTTPITTSYVLGLDNAYSVAVAGRDSMKACNALSEEVKVCEYTARTLQMVTSNIDNVVDGDCGSTRYKEWLIKDDIKKLKEVAGKYFLDQDTNEVRPITMKDTHLLGKVVLLRHVNGCNHPSSRHVCFTCYGLGAVNYPYASRIGHAHAAETTRDNTQKTISTKHQVGSSMFIQYKLPEGMEKLLKVERSKEETKIKNTRVMINKDFIKKSFSYTMIIPKENLSGLKDIGGVKNIKSINPANVSSIDKFYIVLTNKKDGGVDHIDVEIGMDVSSKSSKKKRIQKGYLTNRFLDFIVNNGDHRYKVMPDGKYIIELDGWDFSQAIFEIPLVQNNKMNFTGDIKEFITHVDPSKEEGYDRSLSTLSNLLNDGFDLPLAVSEIITAAFITTDAEHGDYSCGRGKSNEVTKLREIVNNWSLGCLHGFERQRFVIFNESMFGKNINDHFLDGLICPAEVFEEEQAKRDRYANGKDYRRATLKTVHVR